MAKKKEKKPAAPPKASPRFAGYDGSKRWQVSHPEHRTVKVCAPDEASAIYTAAQLWRIDWTRISCYAYATVQQIIEGGMAKHERAASI